MTARKMHFAVIGIAWTMGLLTTGCGGGNTAPVHGVIIFKDTKTPAKELSGYIITLESTEEPVSATGVVEEDGTFKVNTYRQGDGAIAGKHRVAITPRQASSDAPPPTSLLPARYGTLKDSGLQIEVKLKQTNPIELEVERLTP